MNINKLLKSTCLICIILLTVNNLYAQENATQGKIGNENLYIGIGLGLDYGGVGFKLEYQPIKQLGIFGGLGYNLYSAGPNIGCTYKILPNSRACPNILAFYGYNGVITGLESEVSYNVTFGGSLDCKVGHKGSKVSLGIFVPIRSSKFMDTYNSLKDDPYVDISTLYPITISIGYNFAL